MEPAKSKADIRALALERRAAQERKDELSRAIWAKIVVLDEFRQAHMVAVYVDARSEVRTRGTIGTLLAGDKCIVVPYAADGELGLFLLREMNELEPGLHGILEPRQELREQAGREVEPRDIDLFLVPGVAFDTDGSRLGHGYGYYDKLLAKARADARIVALAFDCQLMPSIPREPHDVLVHKIVTETTVYAPDEQGR